jgi:PAS domain-containing protein
MVQSFGPTAGLPRHFSLLLFSGAQVHDARGRARSRARHIGDGDHIWGGSIVGRSRPSRTGGAGSGSSGGLPDGESPALAPTPGCPTAAVAARLARLAAHLFHAPVAGVIRTSGAAGQWLAVTPTLPEVFQQPAMALQLAGAAAHGTPVCVDWALANPSDAAYRLAEESGLMSWAAVPVHRGAGDGSWVLVVADTIRRTWREADLDLLADLAGTACPDVPDGTDARMADPALPAWAALSHEGVLSTDRGGIVRGVNAAWESLVGADAATIVGTNVSTLVSPRDRARLRRIGATRERAGVAWHGRIGVHTATGTRALQVSIAHAGDGYVATVRPPHAGDALALLDAMAHHMAQSVGHDTVLARLLDAARAATGWPYAEAWVPDVGGHQLTLAVARHAGSADLEAFAQSGRTYVFPRGSGLPGAAWVERTIVRWRADQSDMPSSRGPAATAAGLRTVIGIPLFDGDTLLTVLIFGVTDVEMLDPLLVEAVRIGATHLLPRSRSLQTDASEGSTFREVLDLAPTAMLIHRAGRVLYANAATAALFGGFTADPMIGGAVRDLLGPTTKVSGFEGVTGAPLGEAYMGVGIPLRRFDGTLVYVNAWTTHVRFQGTPAVLVTLHPIGRG